LNLLATITTGSAASLVAALLLLPVWSYVARHFNRSSNDTGWRTLTVRTEIFYLSWHMIAGATLGLLFWLSWGFAALDMTSWWTHGLIIGAAYALLLMLPMVGICAAVIRISKAAWCVLLTEVMATSIAVGMACSWNWMHGR